MTERLLQAIWQFQCFSRTSLCTTDGLPVQVVHPGTCNANQGPDFLDAKIKLGDTMWAGHVELHVHSSDWKAHGHSADPNYQNIILHVVWLHDQETGMAFETLELQSRVSKLLFSNYEDLMLNKAFIPCQKHLPGINNLVLTAWKERLLVERLQHKAAMFQQYLAVTGNHWEEACWWLLARNFGGSVNGQAFEKIAQSIPFAALTKVSHQLLQAEALLLGQAGLLEGAFEDDYAQWLGKEYRFLQHKYQLIQPDAPVHHLRMRPPGFPALRLAQLAKLIHQQQHLFTQMRECATIPQLVALLDVTAGSYWDTHYQPDTPAGVSSAKKLGTQMIHNILINTMVPAVFTYGLFHRLEAYKEKALQWLQLLPAEQNNITRDFAALGIKSHSATDSQALIQLKNEYCNKRRCLDCAVGNQLLRKGQ